MSDRDPGVRTLAEETMRIELSTKDRKRFEKFVNRSGGPDACHPWTGSLDREGGYGQFHVGGRLQKAHRVAWCLAGNEITPERPFILHHCDNPPCCNEWHLWDGTRADNIGDMAKKGRGTRSRNGLPFGVVAKPDSSRFYAQVQINGKSRYLGGYDTAEEASAVATKAKHRALRAELGKGGEGG